MITKMCGKYILPVLLCLVSLAAGAQDYIDEDFLENLELNAKPMWAESNPAFAVTSVDEKYNTESAVIIAYKRKVSLDKKSRVGFFSKGDRSLTFYEEVRFKTKLNDKYAVKSFTEIYFRYRDKADGFSAHIIKPDGTVVTAQLDEAVGVESNSGIPEFFKSFFDQEVGNEARYYKVAIPGLEPGDILEYVAVTTSKLGVSSRGYIEFTPQYELCSKKYPILYNQISIETDDKTYFKSMSFNGAPDFKKESAAEGFFKYVFTDVNRNVEKDVNFVNVYRVYPMTKFQVIYAGKTENKGALIGEKGEMKTGFTKQEIAEKAWEEYEQMGEVWQRDVVQMFNEIKSRSRKNLSDEDFIRKAYYWIRNKSIFMDQYMSDKMAAYYFGSLLFQRNIQSDLIITTSKNTGTLKDVLFDSEIRYAVRVGDSIYFNSTEHSNPKELVQELLGVDAYIISKPDKRSAVQIKPLVLPNAGPESNTASYTIDASMDSSLSNVIVKRTSEYRGISKARNIGDALRFTPYILEDYQIFGGTSPSQRFGASSGYYDAVTALRRRFEKEKPEYVKSQLRDEYPRSKVDSTSFELEKNGRSWEEPDLIFKEGYQLSGLVRKAGKKYLVNVAGLIGSQLQIKKEERVRTFDINVGYGRSLTWVINFTVPKGYTADGLAELASTVDNETGKFTSSATQKDGVVTITINKTYKQANFSKDKWADMLAFVDAAYNNSFRYILLKPKN